MNRLLVALTLALAIALAPACAAVLPVLPQIVSVLTDALAVLKIIDNAANEYFRTHPDTPPEVRARYVELYADAINALNAANHSLRGASDLDQKQYDAAFEEFKGAYVELAEFLKREGLMSGSMLKTGDGTEVKIPEPEALSFKVEP